MPNNQNTMETNEKESTPIQALVRNIDECLNQYKKVYTPHQLGFLQGLLETRRACEKLLELEKEDLKKTYEAGRSEQSTKSGEQYLAEIYGKIELTKEPEFEYLHDEGVDNSFRTFIGSNATDWIRSQSKFARRVFYVFLTFLMFVAMISWALFFIVTLRFSRLDDIAKDVSKKTAELEDFLKL